MKLLLGLSKGLKNGSTNVRHIYANLCNELAIISTPLHFDLQQEELAWFDNKQPERECFLLRSFVQGAGEDQL